MVGRVDMLEMNKAIEHWKQDSIDLSSILTTADTQYRNAGSEKAIKYNDDKLNIKWPIKKPIVSKKDQKAITFVEFKKKYL